MKGRMDVLNLSNQRSAKSSAFGGVIKIETDNGREKENCRTDLVIDSRIKSMDVDFESAGGLASDDDDDDDVEMEDEEDEGMIPNLPVLSVIIKEEDHVLNYNDDVPLPRTCSDVEIKYEDDIEEEEYDSEDSMHIREMPPLSIRPDAETSDTVQPNGQHNPYLTTFGSSLLNFDHNRAAAERILSASEENAELSGSDSVLLSIVYATINVPFSQVSKFLTGYHLSKSQLSVIRKVRRQVKNRLYAQNCRRRRIAHIKNLSDELKQMKGEKEKMSDLQRKLLAKKAELEKRYAALHAYVMTVVKDRWRTASVEATDNSDTEEQEERFYQLEGERAFLEEKRAKLETEYHHLHKHIFEVISERYTDSDSCFTKTGADNPFSTQLRSMNIANELAILNQYYSKNNGKGSSREPGDLDSSVSIDSSRTSENKMNDFIDYESSVSVDDSRTGENTRDGLVEYESGVTDEVCTQAYAPAPGVAGEVREAEDVNDDDDDDEEDEMRVARCKTSDDDEDGTTEDDDEERTQIGELRSVREDLETRREEVQEQYTKLYDHVSKVSGMAETEFLKTFMDYCIQSLLEMSRQT